MRRKVDGDAEAVDDMWWVASYAIVVSVLGEADTELQGSSAV
jgi:hypothetical protein